VIAFGPDAELRAAFEPFRIRGWDIAPLEPIGTRTSDVGLLYDALARALVRGRPLRIEARGRLLAIERDQVDADSLKPIKAASGELRGTIPGTGLPWAEAVQVSLELQLGRLWLVYEPTIWAAMPTDDRVRASRAAFIKERGVRRYNEQSNILIDAWAKLLGSDGPISAFGLPAGDGLDAEFLVSPTTAFARKGA
jgi:hypothetical protein